MRGVLWVGLDLTRRAATDLCFWVKLCRKKGENMSGVGSETREEMMHTR